MLQKIIIRNYAIIDYLELTPDAHLNTVTGETGAGKSIILGALSLILGERADTTVLINKDEKCMVEAYFDVKDNKSFRKAMVAEGFDDEEQCIVRREISSAGKSRAFINDTPATLGILNKLTSLLVDLHQQFDHLALQEDHFQIDVLDAIAQTNTLRNAYQQLYQQYKKVSQQLAEKRKEQTNRQKEADYKQFLLDELTEAKLQPEEIEQAGAQLKQMSHAERIIGVLQVAYKALEEGEQPMTNELKRINQQLQSIGDVMSDAAPLVQRITSVIAELKDVADELDGLQSKVAYNEEHMAQLQERIDIGYKLLKKHGVQATNELLSIQEQLENDLQATNNLNETIDQLTHEQETIFKQLSTEAQKLSAQRQKVAPEIAGKVTKLLALVGMPNAQFKINITQQAPADTGIDAIQFLLDANKSGQFLPVQKAASGGEMSRIMLCIKSLTAQAMHLPTLIFDEVDTGISGEAARQVGILLRDLSNYHQVICITHQPQVAARGTNHMHVYKDAQKDGRITTKIRVLQTDERVLAIARMIGGEKPSDAALQNARELVG